MWSRGSGGAGEEQWTSFRASEHSARTGHWFLGFSTTRAGMENPAVPLDCFDSCSSLSRVRIGSREMGGILALAFSLHFGWPESLPVRQLPGSSVQGQAKGRDVHR